MSLYRPQRRIWRADGRAHQQRVERMGKRCSGEEQKAHQCVGIRRKQPGSAAAVLLPYIAFTEDFSAVKIEPKALVFLLITGIVHTGIAYALYFGSIGELPAQTTAIFSYIDPVAAIILSAVFLDEKLGFSGAAGAFLILGSAFLSETEIKINKKRV